MSRPLRTTLDVSALPTVAFGNPGLVWWGTVGFMVIEGFSLAICVAAYLYLRKNFPEWPPPRTPVPDLLAPTIGVIVAVASNVPMMLVSRAARRFDRSGVTRWLVVSSLVGIAMLVIRGFEFAALNTRWDNHAYGSIVWATVGFHALLLVMEVGETIGGLAMFLAAPIQEKHFTDGADNAMYWAFCTLAWVPLFVVVYLLPRWT
jgi:heme/copper-type cytochrome/quinol oxidase subunit 3